MKHIEEYKDRVKGKLVYALADNYYFDTTGKKTLVCLPAIWFELNKQKKLTVREGVLYEAYGTFDEAKTADMDTPDNLTWDIVANGMYHPVYPTFTWDGETMESYMNDAAKERAKKRLGKILDSYPNIPEGYKGWYDMGLEG